MLKYLTKLAMEILPSVLATIIGAYIVNHYISAKPATDTPAAAVSSLKADARSDPGKTDAKDASVPEAGVKAKAIAEKAMGIAEKALAGRTPTDNAAEKPVEASLNPVDAHRNPFASREKAEKPVAKTAPAPVTPVVTAPNASPAPAPPESATAPEEHRDAADLARAAIERLRATDAHPQDAARVPEPPRVQGSQMGQDVPRVIVTAPPAVRPLPPPVTVGGPGADTSLAAAPPLNPPYTGAVRSDDPTRPTPPADIPPPPPLDLRASGPGGLLNPREQATKVAEDMLSAAKSVFHAVLPHRDHDRDSAN